MNAYRDKIFRGCVKESFIKLPINNDDIANMIENNLISDNRIPSIFNVFFNSITIK